MRLLADLDLRQRLAIFAALCAVLVAVLMAARGGAPPEPESPATAVDGVQPAAGEAEAFVDVVDGDPFEYGELDDDELIERASVGLSHVIYELSPDGVEATAARTARFRDEVEAAAGAARVEPDTLEALVFLESAGRPDVIAGTTPDAAAGLGQILPETAESLLDMSVDLEASSEITRQIVEQERRVAAAGSGAERERAERRLGELLDERRAVDERFDPREALAGAARYLALAEERFGREDLAATSYHMGIGNLESVISSYLEPLPTEGSTRATVEEHELSYARLYFDSTPTENPATHDFLRELGDESRHYLFKLEAARDIMDLHRVDPEALAELAELYTAEESAAAVLRPPGDTDVFEDGDELATAYEDGELVGLPDRPERLGFEAGREAGRLAGRLELEPEVYRGLRPEALAALVHIARELREVTGEETTLTLTSAVRDVPYHELVAGREAGGGYSPHTTGYSFELARDLAGREEEALYAVLERLEALAVVAWNEQRESVEVTVGPEAEALVEDSGAL